MKKILAIVLAAIMAFSLGVIGFAEDAVEAPAFPTQEAGKVYFASEAIEVEAGQVYQIPVYIVANYTPAITGTAVVGFSAKVTGDAESYIKVLAISATEDAENLVGYQLLGADSEQIAFKTTDMNIFKQEKLAIANVLVEVSSEYAGQTATLEIKKANYAKYLDDAEAMLVAATSAAVINGINVDAVEVEFVSADIVQYIPLPWNEKLRNWFLEQSDKILTFLVAICQTLAGLVPTL